MIERPAKGFGSLRAFTSRLRERASAIPCLDVLAAYGILLVVSILALLNYMVAPVEPFAFYKDLGFNHEVTDWAVHTIHGPLDFFDTLAWAPWNGTKLFFLSSYLTELITTPISWITGNSWLAIKIVQVLETVTAFAGGAAMYATASRNRFWALAFGTLFGALPTSQLAIRGNIDLGLIAALMPGTIAVGRFAIRRFGVRAAPLVGVLCGFTGFVIAIEFLVFVSLPLYALIVLAERQRYRFRSWLFVALGIACSVASGAFFLLPTFSHPLFTDAAVRTASLSTGAFLDNFSQTWLGLLVLVQRESYASPIPDFNAGPDLVKLVFSGTLIWAGSILFICSHRNRRGLWTDGASLAIVLGCIVLALGTTLPFGRALWDALLAIPGVDAIRTADRFLAIPSLMLAFWFVCSLEAGANRYDRQRTFRYVALAVTLGIVAFDRSQHCFSLDHSKGERYPQFDAVAATVARVGGRTASFAGINGGSFDDAAEYGIPQPISAAYWDLGGRFLQAGLGSVGVLGRLATASIITAPNWTFDTPNHPITSNLYRHVSLARPIFSSAENVGVWAIPARAMVAPVHVACVYGGPGAFDLLDVADELKRDAFTVPEGDCATNGYIDFDPTDRWRQLAPLDAWAGSDLLPHQKRVLDFDYPFLPNRVLVNVPWYRNSVDGDAPLFRLDGAVVLASGAGVQIASHRTWPAGSSINVRLLTHSQGRLKLTVGQETIRASVAPGLGFRWYRLALPKNVASTVPISLSFNAEDGDAPGANLSAADGTDAIAQIALDGIAVLPAAESALASRRALPARFFAWSLNRFDEARHHREVRSTVLQPQGLDSMHFGTVAQEPTLVADRSRAGARYRWTGSTGMYAIEALGWLDTTNASLVISVGTTCCVATATRALNAAPETKVDGRVYLRYGSIVNVDLVQPLFTAGTASRIDRVRVIPATQPRFSVAGTGSVASIDFSRPYGALAQLGAFENIQLNAQAAQGGPGSQLSFVAAPQRAPVTMSVTVAKMGDGSGSLQLVCNGHSLTQPLTDASTSVVVDSSSPLRCRGTVRWGAAPFGIRSIVFFATGRAGALVQSVWSDAGHFYPIVLRADGSRDDVATVRISGCPNRARTCVFERAGFHSIEISEHDPSDALLVLTSESPEEPRDPIAVAQLSALRWHVDVRRKSDIALAQLFDEHWQLVRADGTAYSGERCDIVSTCFTNVAPGSYRIGHSWPAALVEGFAITAVALLGSLLLLLLPTRNLRGRAA